MTTRRWKLGLAGLSLALGLAAAEPGETGDHPVIVRTSLEVVIPAKVQPLLMENPQVRFWVTVDAEGKLVDFLAIEATHYDLLDRAEEALRTAEFAPAVVAGRAAQAAAEVTVTFFDAEQRAYHMGLISRPFGTNPTESAQRRLYAAAPDRFVYRRANAAELDRPVDVVDGRIKVLADAAGKPAEGRCVVEFYVDRNGEVRQPRVLESDNEAVALSALLTLRATHFAPVTRAGAPTYVRVRQPMTFAPAPAADAAK